LEFLGASSPSLSDLKALKTMDPSSLSSGDFDAVNRILCSMAVRTLKKNEQPKRRNKRSNSAFNFPASIFDNADPTMTFLKALRKEILVQLAESWTFYSLTPEFAQNYSDVPSVPFSP
jgi:hypothetical protein